MKSATYQTISLHLPHEARRILIAASKTDGKGKRKAIDDAIAKVMAGWPQMFRRDAHG